MAPGGRFWQRESCFVLPKFEVRRISCIGQARRRQLNFQVARRVLINGEKALCLPRGL
jgi:hypothetical protein